jgi:hypothetical protein
MTGMLRTPWASRGAVANASASTASAGFTTTDTLLPGIADVSLTVVPNRLYLLLVTVQFTSTVAGDTAVVVVRDGGVSLPTISSTSIFDARTQQLSTAAVQAWTGFSTWQPTAGLHRLAITVRRSTGTGTLTAGDATRTSQLLVVDLGLTP